MAEKLREILRLENINYLNQVSLRKLLSGFSTAEECRDLDNEILAKYGISNQGIINLRASDLSTKVYDEQMLLLEKLKGVKVISFFDSEYPSNLKNIYDPPLYLFYQGELSAKDEISLAVVGSRSVSRIGISNISKISRQLAESGFVIVSGLAMGSDTFAHKGALETGNRTVAVLGTGIDKPVNQHSRRTRQRIIEKGGAVISPFRIGTEATKYTFPSRNRIISGISLGVLIGEAKKKSGSLITADFALEQGREVFALPNQIYDPRYEGSNGIIKKGQAKLVSSLDDIIEEMPEYIRNRLSPAYRCVREKDILFTDGKEENIYNALMQHKKTVDELSDELNYDTGSLMSKLFILEMNGLVIREPNNMFSINRK